MAIARVSGQLNDTTSVSAGESYDIAFPGSLSVGDLVVGVVSRFAVGSRTAWADGGMTKIGGTGAIGTSTVAVQQVTAGTDTLDVAILTALVTTDGTLTLRFQTDANNYYWWAAICAYSGNWDTSRLEASNSATATFSSTSNASPDSGNATSAGAALFVGGLAIGHTDPSITEDAAFSLIGEEEDWDNGMAGSAIDRIVSSGTTDSASWSCIGAQIMENNSWGAVVAVLKESGGTNGDVTGVAGTATAAGGVPVVESLNPGTIYSTVEL